MREGWARRGMGVPYPQDRTHAAWVWAPEPLRVQIGFVVRVRAGVGSHSIGDQHDCAVGQTIDGPVKRVENRQHIGRGLVLSGRIQIGQELVRVVIPGVVHQVSE